MTYTRFISDIHLDPGRPHTYDRFEKYLNGILNDTDALYILGDLFEFWIGDDGIDLLEHQRTAELLRKVSDAGIPVYIMHGNRDFLIGDVFVGMFNGALLPDPTVVDIKGTPTLLMHGDSLCTDDVEHQKFRQVVNSDEWQTQFLSLPVSERLNRAMDMRKQSESGKATKNEALMDVTETAVCEAIRQAGVQQMIHGHVHQPGIHRHEVDGNIATRYVLGDWDSGRDGVLRINPDGVFDLHVPD